MEKRDSLLADYNAAVAAKKAVDDKITRLNARKEHLRNDANTKGYIIDLNKLKGDNETLDAKYLKEIKETEDA